MENLRCAEFLAESPSTSSASSRLRGTPASVGGARHHHSAQQQQPILRRRGTKSDIGLRHSSNSDTKLVLGQIPVSSRKRQQPATYRLNNAQWPSVQPLADKTVHCDDRCLDSMFKAQAATPINGNLFLTVQVDVTAHHRQQTIEWLYDVCKEEQCEADVFLLAVLLVDRYLSVECVFRNNLQALAGSCLFVSSKVKAPQPLNAERIAYYTDGAVRMDQILQGEIVVLSKLNWDVSISTALDFLDQVAARYSELRLLSEDCLYAAHRIQLDAKFAFLVPSVQAAVCLLFTAVFSGDTELIHLAENAVTTVLRCEPRMVRDYMESVQSLISGFDAGTVQHPRNRSPSRLIVPPPSEESPDISSCPTPSPSGAGTAVRTLETTLSPAFTHSTGNAPNRGIISDDSGFVSDFTSPAAVFSANKFGGANSVGSREASSSFSTSSRRRLKRSTTGHLQSQQARLNSIRRASYESVDSGVIAYYHASEEEFLASY